MFISFLFLFWGEHLTSKCDFGEIFKINKKALFQMRSVFGTHVPGQAHPLVLAPQALRTGAWYPPLDSDKNEARTPNLRHLTPDCLVTRLWSSFMLICQVTRLLLPQVARYPVVLGSGQRLQLPSIECRQA